MNNLEENEIIKHIDKYSKGNNWYSKVFTRGLQMHLKMLNGYKPKNIELQYIRQKSQKYMCVEQKYKILSKDMRLYFRGLLYKVIPKEIQSRIAIITCGSFQTHNTGYSDIEFGILVKEPKDIPILVDLMTELYIKIIDLGETPLRALAIPEYESIYFDFNHIEKAGLRFDGGKSRYYPLPITDVCDIPFLLQATPTEFYKMILTHINCKHHLTWNFLSPHFLCGDKTLYDEYVGLIDPKLYTIYKFDHFQPEFKHKYIFKYDMYRNLLAFDNLAYSKGIYGENHWAILKRLYLPSKVHIIIKNLINWIHDYRLKIYTYYKGQHDQINVALTKNSLVNQSKYLLTDLVGLCFTFYAGAICLSQVINSIKQQEIIKNPIVPYKDIIYFLSNTISRNSTDKQSQECNKYYNGFSDKFIDHVPEIPYMNQYVWIICCLINHQMNMKKANKLTLRLINHGLSLVPSKYDEQIKITNKTPTLYTILLYLKARMYFYDSMLVNQKESYDLAIQALEFRQLINTNKLDDSWNENAMDDLLIKRSLLFIHQKDKAKTIEELVGLINEYNKIAKTGDIVNKMECLHFISKILVKIYHMNHDKKYLNDAKEHISIINSIMPLDYGNKNKIVATERLIINYYIDS